MVKTRKGSETTVDDSSHLGTRVEKFEETVLASIEQLKKQIVGDTENAESTDTASTNSILEKISQMQLAIVNEVNLLKCEISKVGKEGEKLRQMVTHQAQEKLRNTLVINGIPEKQPGDAINEAILVFNRKIKIEVTMRDIDCAYRLGRKNDNKTVRPVAVVFTNRWLRDKIFWAKKALKGTDTVISEMLTSDNLKLYKSARQKLGAKQCWTWRGSVYATLMAVSRK